MTRLIRKLLLIGQVTLSIVPCTIVLAQGSSEISSTVACAGCTVQLASPVAIEVPGWPTHIARDSRGRIFASFDGRFLPMVFDKQGHHLRDVGTFARGKDQLVDPYFIAVGPGDSVIIADAMRMLTLDSQLRIVRKAKQTGRVRSIVAPSDGTRIISANIPTRERIGYAAHVLRPDGSIIRSFDLLPAAGPDRPTEQPIVTAARGGDLWLSSLFTYEFSKWNPAGHRIAAFTRKPGWFVKAPDPAGRPASRVVSAREDSQGHLWHLVLLPSAKWRDHMPREEKKGEIQIQNAPRPDQIYDTMIEVTDPATNELLVSQRLDGYFHTIIDDSHVASFTETNGGNGVVTIWTIHSNFRRKQ